MEIGVYWLMLGLLWKCCICCMCSVYYRNVVSTCMSFYCGNVVSTYTKFTVEMLYGLMHARF